MRACTRHTSSLPRYASVSCLADIGRGSCLFLFTPVIVLRQRSELPQEQRNIGAIEPGQVHLVKTGNVSFLTVARGNGKLVGAAAGRVAKAGTADAKACRSSLSPSVALTLENAVLARERLALTISAANFRTNPALGGRAASGLRSVGMLVFYWHPQRDCRVLAFLRLDPNRHHHHHLLYLVLPLRRLCQSVDSSRNNT